MGRRLRQTVTALATTALAAGAIVAVFYALPDGGDSVSPSNAASNATAVVVSTDPVTTDGETSSAGAVTVPALTAPTGTGETAAAAETTTPATSGPEAADTTTTAAQQLSETTSSAAITVASPPATPATPATTRAAVTRTAAPTTTAAPKTTAPATTKTSTTAPTTTAPKPTAPDFGIAVSTGNARQVITVAVTSKAATSGTLRAWQQQKDGSWKVVYGPVKAWLGRQGIGTPSESASRTPQGTYTLTEAFGTQQDPGTALPYRMTGPNDWWVSDVRAASYNTWQTCAAAACPFNTKAAEHLKYITPYYDYAVVMDVNRSPVVAGGGSAFFLHVSVGAPTEGCVAIDKATLVAILRWLDPAQHPRIAVGVS